jgi:hypothetical protein
MNEETHLQTATKPALNIASVSKSALVKTFVLTVSRYFPKTHKRAGEPTCFVEKILSEQIACGLISKSEVEKYEPFSMFVFNTDEPKLHTIRANYPLWENRIKQVQKGKAIISLRYWSGKPYNSKQIEFCQLDKDSGIGIQGLQMTALGWFVNGYDSDFTTKDFAKNDGLTPIDFSEWFRGKISIDMEPMAIIHFTHYRY